MTHTTADSPFRTATYQTTTRRRMKVADVEAAFKATAKNTFYEAITDTFIAAFFPVSNGSPSPAEILSQLKKSGCYDAGKGRWADFPDVINNEKDLYKPFAATANAIVSCLKEVKTQITYLDRHSVRPFSLDEDMPAGRPDGVGVNFNDEMIELDKEIENLENSVRTTRGAAKRLEENCRELKEQMKDLRNEHKVWWRGIHVPYEIKLQANRAEWIEAIEQLVVYMCHMLTEQLDRRFVLGMVLCLDELKVVLCDRSGVLSTKTSFNIHKEPEKFIQIIAGFSMIGPAALGWDTDMKIYDVESDDTKSSFVMVSLLTNLTRYQLHWVIRVRVDPSSESNVKKEYISVATISALRASEICTRATVVFEVVEFEKRFNPTETWALKRYWRPVDDDPGLYPHEGEIYNILDEDRQSKLPHMVAFEDIEIEGRKDDTVSYARRGIEGDPIQRPMIQHRARYENDLDANPNLHQKIASGDREQKTPFTNRQHINVLMPMGETFKGVCSLKELLICFEHYVQDHRHAHDRSILHRDISSGNLLIFENEDGPFGRLIDYDHAKYTEDSIPAKHYLASRLKKKEEQRFLRKFHDQLQDLQADKIKTLQEEKENKKGAEDDDDDKDRFKPKFTVEDEVALKAYEFILDPSEAATYVYNVITRQFPNTLNQVVLTKANLGWEHEHPVEDWPSYEDRQPRMDKRTGTVPYMSAEVILQKRVFKNSRQPKKQPPPFVHQAIHDMESLFWVLVHTCITRKGPGFEQRRSEDLDLHSPSFKSELHDTVVRYFDNDDDSAIGDAKRDLMMYPDLEDSILAHFHPAYDALKPLVRKWWTVLVLGYEYEADEFYNIHNHILRILRETNILDDDTDLAHRLREQRKQRKQHRLDTFKPSPTTPTTASSGLPPSQSVLQATPPGHQSVEPKSRPEYLESPLATKRAKRA